MCATRWVTQNSNSQSSTNLVNCASVLDRYFTSTMCGIREPNTLSNISQVKTTHLHLDWTISFEKKILSGHVVLDLITLVDNVDKVVLDTSFLDVTKASYEGKDVKVGF